MNQDDKLIYKAYKEILNERYDRDNHSDRWRQNTMTKNQKLFEYIRTLNTEGDEVQDWMATDGIIEYYQEIDEEYGVSREAFIEFMIGNDWTSEQAQRFYEILSGPGEFEDTNIF